MLTSCVNVKSDDLADFVNCQGDSFIGARYVDGAEHPVTEQETVSRPGSIEKRPDDIACRVDAEGLR